MLQLGDAAPVKAKLIRTSVGGATAEPTNALSLHGKAVQLVCGDGSVLEVLKLTMPGRKPRR